MAIRSHVRSAENISSPSHASETAGRICVGVGGWTYAPWRRSFYPAGLPQRKELSHAAQVLTSIEINATFYGTQKPSSFLRWRDETPDDFIFAVKAPRYATGRRHLADSSDSIARFLESGVTRLGPKLGPILWQLPATKVFDAKDLSAFMRLLPRSADGLKLRHAIEYRHGSFNCDTAIHVAAQHEVAVVYEGDSKFPVIPALTSTFCYLRLMGSKPRPLQGYRGAQLKQIQSLTQDLAAGKIPPDWNNATHARRGIARDVFCYFIAGHKANNPGAARALIDLLQAGKQKL